MLSVIMLTVVMLTIALLTVLSPKITKRQVDQTKQHQHKIVTHLFSLLICRSGFRKTLVFLGQDHFPQLERFLDQRGAKHQGHDGLLRQAVDEGPVKVGGLGLGRPDVKYHTPNDGLGSSRPFGIGRAEAAKLEVEVEFVVGKKAENPSGQNGALSGNFVVAADEA
jgi:hypothetical protein